MTFAAQGKFENLSQERFSIQIPGTMPDGLLRFGLGVTDEIVKHITANIQEKNNVLFIVDPVIRTLGSHCAMFDFLNKEGFTPDIFSEIEPEPSLETIQKLQDHIKDKIYCAVLGLGGGSSLDVAKFASILYHCKCEPLELIQGQIPISKALPVFLIPTTSGTGSEVSPYIVLSHEGKKLFLQSSYAYATVALVDPLLTMTMPAKVTAATGLDALSHGVEGVIGKDFPYTRALSRECVKLVFNYLPRAVENADDVEARYYMAFASVLGMLAYSQGGGLYAHSVSYILTSAHKIPHGLGCGLALPYTLKMNESEVEDILADYGNTLHLNGQGKANSGKVILQFYQLLQKVGVPVSLKEIGVSEEEIPHYAQSLLQDYFRARNPRNISMQDSISLLQAMYAGELQN
ncbi:MAG: iron-containing alcohol dehydrogenase [Synergistaceae bacterium]|jgi:alcohol dehydrogenase|nr:iron-containing alcohol dehydrogenase [Synergistaceae bacterium]